MAQEKGNAKLLRIIDKKLDDKFQLMTDHFDVLIQMGKINQSELQDNYKELRLNIRDMDTDIRRLKDLLWKIK